MRPCEEEMIAGGEDTETKKAASDSMSGAAFFCICRIVCRRLCHGVDNVHYAFSEFVSLFHGVRFGIDAYDRFCV